MSLAGDAREAGASTVSAWRTSMARHLAGLLQRDPDLVETAIEVGIIDRQWLEEPGRHPLRTSTTLEVVRRFLERSVERHPSAIGALGLNAIDLLSWNAEEAPTEGVTTSLTIVFTDLEDFTRFTARAGDDAATTLLAEQQRVVGPVVRSRGGRVVKRLGDGLMLSFPSPEAAVLAALELLDTAPTPLRMRAGVHCGDAVVTRDDVIGHVVNVAARVAEVARGDQVLVTAPVRDASADLPGVVFGRARRRQFKGVGESVAVCRAQRAAT